MATVAWFRFDFLDASGFAPGQTRTWEHGWNPPGTWAGRAVVVSAWPFDASNQDRGLTVTEIRHRSTNPGQFFLRYTIRNSGVNTIIIYHVLLGIISA
jgi:hypothetical protein